MAEAAAVIGLVASIASLVDLSIKIVSRVRDCNAHSSDVPKTFRSLADRLPLLTQTLQRIEARAQAGSVPVDVVKELDRLVKSILEQVRFVEQCLNEVTPTTGASRIDRLRNGFKSLAKDEKVKQAVEKIHHGIDVLVLHQTTTTIDVSDRILEELKRLNLRGSTQSNTTSHKSFGLRLGQAPLIEPDAFVGRKVEIQQLHDWLKPSAGITQRVASVVGMGGLGKTQLSLAYAREYGHEYSSVFWVDARDEVTVRQNMAALSCIIENGSTDDEGTQVDKVRRWLSEEWNTQWLVIFDNYDDPNLPNIRSSTGFDIRSFFPHRTQGSILITTRSPKLTFSKRLILQKLEDVSMGVAMLSQRSMREFNGDVDARRLAVRLDGLPLALVTAGTYLGQTNMSCAEYLQAYESQWVDLHDFNEVLEYEDRTLVSTWIISLEQVRCQDADAAELFEYLGYLDCHDFWYELFQSDGSLLWMDRLTASKIRFDRAVSRLRDYSLVDVTSGKYNVHPCIHDWICAYFQLSAVRFSAALRGVIRNISDENSSQYMTETRRLLAHMRHLQKERFHSLWAERSLDTLKATHAFGDVFRDWAFRDEAEVMYLRALAGKEEVLGMDAISTLWTVHCLGTLYSDLGRVEEAEKMYLRALAGREKALGPEHTSTLWTVTNLGNLYVDQGKFEEATVMYRRALVWKDRSTDAVHLLLWTMNNIGTLFKNKGQPREAELIWERALESGIDHISTRITAFNLGSLYESRDKVSEAEKAFAIYLDACAKHDEFVLWKTAVNDLARDLWTRIRVREDRSAARIRLRILIRFVKIWVREDKLCLYWLARSFACYKDDENARIALFIWVQEDGEELDFDNTFCDGCGCRITIATGRHICRSCEDYDLCGKCISEYTTLALPGCSGHEWFDTGCTQYSKDRSGTEIGEWLDKIEKQYAEQQK